MTEQPSHHLMELVYQATLLSFLANGEGYDFQAWFYDPVDLTEIDNSPMRSI